MIKHIVWLSCYYQLHAIKKLEHSRLRSPVDYVCLCMSWSIFWLRSLMMHLFQSAEVFCFCRRSSLVRMMNMKFLMWMEVRAASLSLLIHLLLILVMIQEEYQVMRWGKCFKMLLQISQYWGSRTMPLFVVFWKLLLSLWKITVGDEAPRRKTVLDKPLTRWCRKLL